MLSGSLSIPRVQSPHPPSGDRGEGRGTLVWKTGPIFYTDRESSLTGGGRTHCSHTVSVSCVHRELLPAKLPLCSLLQSLPHRAAVQSSSADGVPGVGWEGSPVGRKDTTRRPDRWVLSHKDKGSRCLVPRGGGVALSSHRSRTRGLLGDPTSSCRDTLVTWFEMTRVRASGVGVPVHERFQDT